MCGECNESENVEPSEDLNTVNVHDGTWRECVPRIDSVEIGDCWADTGRIVDRNDVGTLYVRGLWRRIPEHERTPVQQSTELPIPSESIMLPVVSEIGDNRPDEQRTIDNMLTGMRSGCMHEDGQRYETPLETMSRLYPYGYGITEHGALFSLGFTGKRKAMSVGQLKESLNWSYSSGEFVTLLQQWGKQFPPKIKTAHGDDIQEVFEKYRPGSCMSGCGCRDMREIYACNPKSVGVVYSIRDTSNNPLIESSCSALFWIGSKRIYLDRMYSSGSANAYVQYDWFADHLETVYSRPCVPIYTSTKQRRQYDKTITFKLKDSGKPLPYIDSLYTVKEYDGEHVWLTSDESAGDVHCRDTSGTHPDGRDRCQCSGCDCNMDEDDACHYGGDIYCGDCYSGQFSYCCWNEEDYPSDEIQSVECWSYGSRYREQVGAGSRNGYSLGWHTLAISDSALSDYFTELYDGRYASNGNTVEDNRGNVHATDCESWNDVTLTEDGDLYHVDDVVQLSDGRTYPADDCVEVDGEWYLCGEEPAEDSAEESDEETTELQKEMVTE